jgi:uncharacterized protein YeaO (DUF488 family)
MISLRPCWKKCEPFKEKAKGQPITLRYGAKDVKYNNAVAIREYIEEKM